MRLRAYPQPAAFTVLHTAQLSKWSTHEQSPEDSPCDRLVQCLLSAVIMPNKAL